MDTELEYKLNVILQEKQKKILPGNIKKGVSCLDINGTLDFSNFNDYENCNSLIDTLLGTNNKKELYLPLNFLHVSVDKVFTLNGFNISSNYKYFITLKDNTISNYEVYLGALEGNAWFGRSGTDNKIGFSGVTILSSNKNISSSTPIEYIIKFGSTAENMNLALNTVGSSNVDNGDYLLYSLVVKDASTDGVVQDFIAVENISDASIGLLEKISNKYLPYKYLI